MKTMTRPEPETASPAQEISPAPLSLAEITVPVRVELDASEQTELAASRVFLRAFRAWAVDSSHYSRMMAAFADYQNVIRLNEPRENEQGA